MRVVTFNICSGRSMSDGLVDVDRFAAAVAGLDADLLCLQEVDRDQERSGGADLTRIAAEALGAQHRVFAPALYGTPGEHWTAAGDAAQDGPAYGCALISRVPLRDVEVFRMPAAPIAVPLWLPGHGVTVVREEPRVAIVAQLDSGGVSGLTVVGTHLPFVPVWNRRQLLRVVDHVASRADPVLLLGDLNLRGETPARLTGYRALATAPTFPAANPRFQLDHILLRGPRAGLGPVRATSAPDLPVSDHRPLVVDLDVGR